jgi:hypothetical protein
MQFLNAIAACSILVGIVNLAGHLAGQLREGHATTESLILGGCALAFGVLLSAVANVGIKLNRIENRLKRSSDDQADALSD